MFKISVEHDTETCHNIEVRNQTRGNVPVHTKPYLSWLGSEKEKFAVCVEDGSFSHGRLLMGRKGPYYTIKYAQSAYFPQEE